jgi:hypothetical protein
MNTPPQSNTPPSYNVDLEAQPHQIRQFDPTFNPIFVPELYASLSSEMSDSYEDEVNIFGDGEGDPNTYLYQTERARLPYNDTKVDHYCSGRQDEKSPLLAADYPRPVNASYLTIFCHLMIASTLATLSILVSIGLVIGIFKVLRAVGCIILCRAFACAAA